MKRIYALTARMHVPTIIATIQISEWVKSIFLYNPIVKEKAQ